MRRELEHVEIPGEHDARERTWRIVSTAYAERIPERRSPTRLRLLVAVAAAVCAGVVAAGFSSPGRAVLNSIRETVGVEKTQQALFSLPVEGRLLVRSDDGVWVVQRDGSKRRLGSYAEASWSPFGRFVVAARRNALYALTPGGDERWSLARPGVVTARWHGSRTDTLIAYVDRSGLRVVAGDGTGDRLLSARQRGPFAWQPATQSRIAYATSTELRLQDARTGRVIWRLRRVNGPQATRLEWSSDGRRLLLDAHGGLQWFDSRSGQPLELFVPRIVAAAFRPGSHSLATIRRPGALSQVVLGRKVLFSTAAELDSLAWSADGRWLIVSAPNADQWVFVRADGRKIEAVSNVSEQFRSRSFPTVEGWVSR
jgi:hypothetical protein